MTDVSTLREETTFVVEALSPERVKQSRRKRKQRHPHDDAALRAMGFRRIFNDGFRPKRGCLLEFARSFKVTTRTASRWIRKANRNEPLMKRGRKKVAEDTLLILKDRAREVLNRRGWASGEKTVADDLMTQGKKASLRQVRSILDELKKEHDQACQDAAEGRSLNVPALAKGALWAIDATLLARHKETGDGASTEVVTDAATKSVGGINAYWHASNTKHAIAAMEDMKAQEGQYPLVVSHDNGGSYTSAEFQSYLEDKKIISLVNYPHTPKHNPFAERTIRDVKSVAPWIDPKILDQSLDDFNYLQAQLNETRKVLKQRNRYTRWGYFSANDLDTKLPKAYDLVDRERFYAAAKEAMAAATAKHERRRDQRLAVRYAVLRTLCSFGLIEVYRGGVRLDLNEVDIKS